MNRLFEGLIAHFRKGGEKAATAVEYALMVSLIAIAILVTVNGIGNKIGSSFQSVTTTTMVSK